MIVNPKLMKFFEDETKLRAPNAPGGKQFADEYKALAATAMVNGLVRSFLHYQHDQQSLGFLLASAVLMGVNAGRKLDQGDNILVDAEENIHWDGNNVLWKSPDSKEDKP